MSSLTKCKIFGHRPTHFTAGGGGTGGGGRGQGGGGVTPSFRPDTLPAPVPGRSAGIERLSQQWRWSAFQVKATQAGKLSHLAQQLCHASVPKDSGKLSLPPSSVLFKAAAHDELPKVDLGAPRAAASATGGKQEARSNAIASLMGSVGTTRAAVGVHAPRAVGVHAPRAATGTELDMPRLDAPRGPARGAARANHRTSEPEFRELTDRHSLLETRVHFTEFVLRVLYGISLLL
eukprot:COSAG02_NODE_102_length_36716_cov_233.851025_24_plen_234_part_00